jgi:propionyl-CoA synthetase
MYVTLLDKHIQDGYGDQVAFIYDSPVTKPFENTLLEVKTEVAKLAGGMQSLGLKKGDTAIIYMPMIPRQPLQCCLC